MPGGAGGLGGMEAAVKPMPSHITLFTETHWGARGWLVLSEKEKSSAVGSAEWGLGGSVCLSEPRLTVLSIRPCSAGQVRPGRWECSSLLCLHHCCWQA